MSKNETPYEIPIISVDRNKWFLISVMLTIVLAIVLVDYIRLRVDRSDLDIAWVKVYPNSTYDISFNDLPNKPEFFDSTIDSLLSQFVRYRFQKDPKTIRSDYGIALNFMSNKLGAEFTNEQKYNAIKVAADVMNCGNSCETLKIKVGTIEHYERAKIGDNNAIYRTNLYITEKFYANGIATREAKSIVALQWTILDKDEILSKFSGGNTAEKMMKQLRVNPIGIDILEATKYVDPSNK